MSRAAHFIYLSVFVAVTSIVSVTLAIKGISYYRVSLEERFYHPDHNSLKSSGYVGHSLGIIGSFCIITGVGTYMARKRYRFLSHLGYLKYWLEFHIFMCVLGTFLVVFHTAFKVGGLAGISFWSMVTVFLSGIAGRVIYLKIPRTMEGRELSLREVREMRSNVLTRIKESHNLDEDIIKFISFSIENRQVHNPGYKALRLVRNPVENINSVVKIARLLKDNNIPRTERSGIIGLVRADIRIAGTIERLDLMKNLFRYWHVFHLPFAVMMLIFMIIHVIVTVALGYRWIL